MSPPKAQKSSAPALVYSHIPLPEFASFGSSNFTGVRQEGISSASANSGFFTTMVEAADMKAVFTGHDHLNDFCGQLTEGNWKLERRRKGTGKVRNSSVTIRVEPGKIPDEIISDSLVKDSNQIDKQALEF
ncbi:hypothetical protein CRYUN_Cryun14cG0056700 [Craigia yunnanensis]